MSKVSAYFFCACLLFIAFASSADAGEALAVYEEKKLEAEVVNVSKYRPAGKGKVVGVVVIRKGDERIELLYTGKEKLKIGQKVLFKDNAIKVLR